MYFLKARNSELGLKACKELESEGIRVKFHQLDIEDNESISKFAKYLKENYNGLDILVNNAAIAYKAADPTKRRSLFRLKIQSKSILLAH